MSSNVYCITPPTVKEGVKYKLSSVEGYIELPIS